MIHIWLKCPFVKVKSFLSVKYFNFFTRSSLTDLLIKPFIVKLGSDYIGDVLLPRPHTQKRGMEVNYLVILSEEGWYTL